MNNKRKGPDSTSRLGAHPVEGGVYFAVYSEHAEAVEVCLFGPDGKGRERRVALDGGGDGIWSAAVPDIAAGEHYGFRAHGPWEPQAGHRFNPDKLLLDPYARAVAGAVQWQPGVYPYQSVDPDLRDIADNGQWVPRSVVVDNRFEWTDGERPAIPMRDSVVYELHVKGFTRLHPDVPEADRGTYRGLTAPPVIDYLKRLGVTTLELLPVGTSLTHQHLQDQGLANYWGYDPVAPFAPDARYAREDAVLEFKTMVNTLHREGFEVVLDVVFNHTGEGDECGPAMMLRGLDNRVYYLLKRKNPAHYVDYTGCGNTVNADHPQVLEWILDCLRYWVEEMHVDGFRFDLASTMAREAGAFNRRGAFFRHMAADPVLSNVKLIAEPWDLGPAGYQLGHFPAGWSEWNDRFRDHVRAYWRGDEHQLPELARRFAGSADVFEVSGRGPSASVNLITAHDGFTLRDLVSYKDKHNEANAEENRDGHDHNLSDNYGVEGPTDDEQILALRARQQRNFLTTLLLAHGTPMLLAGDEMNNTQHGNNNAYCQDNEIAWLNWDRLDCPAESLLDFTRLLIDLRRRHAVFRQDTFLSGRLLPEYGYRDVEWLLPDGRPMSPADWKQHFARFIGILLTAEEPGEAHFLLLLNAGGEAVESRLPDPPGDGQWRCVFDTATWPETPETLLNGRDVRHVQARSSVLLQDTAVL